MQINVDADAANAETDMSGLSALLLRARLENQRVKQRRAEAEAERARKVQLAAAAAPLANGEQVNGVSGLLARARATNSSEGRN